MSRKPAVTPLFPKTGLLSGERHRLPCPYCTKQADFKPTMLGNRAHCAGCGRNLESTWNERTITVKVLDR